MGGKPSRLIYQVAVGECPPFYDCCIGSVNAYCARYGITHYIQREPELKIAPYDSKRSVNALRLGYLPIYEKENALACLSEFDQVAIVDADIYIRPESPNIFDAAPGVCFVGVPERDMPLTAGYADKVRKHSEGQFRSLTDVDWKWNARGAHYYNMGLMLLDKSILPYLRGDTPEQFLRRPEFERFINGEGHWKWSTDQTLLNWWLKNERIPTTDLSWKWNALYGAVEDVTESYFVHFFLSAKLKPGEVEKAIESLCHYDQRS